MKRIAGLVFISFLFVTFGCTAAEPGTGVKDISQEQLLSKPPEGALILDVRTPGEYADGHVPKAVNISHDQLASRLSELDSDKDRPIVLYCRSGKRAGMAASVLKKAGFRNLYHLEGDMLGWHAKGLPTEK